MSGSLSRYQYYEVPDGSRPACHIGGPDGDVPEVLLHALAARTNTWKNVAAALIGAGAQQGVDRRLVRVEADIDDTATYGNNHTEVRSTTVLVLGHSAEARAHAIALSSAS